MVYSDDFKVFLDEFSARDTCGLSWSSLNLKKLRLFALETFIHFVVLNWASPNLKNLRFSFVFSALHTCRFDLDICQSEEFKVFC